MRQLSYVAASGMLGAGFQEASLQAAADRNPAFIGCDAGSTDGGPHQLGAGEVVFSRTACERDLRLSLRLARRLGVPLLVGSCNGAGIDEGVDAVADMVRRIAVEEHLAFRLARIYAEPDRAVLKQRLAEGRIRPLAGAPEIRAQTFDQSSHVVAMMGVEPFQRALAEGADVVLAGRSSDTSIYSAIPIAEDYDPGLVWHAAKIMECGSAATSNRKGQDSMLCTMYDDHFVVEPLHGELRCTSVSVAAHTLYENGDPFRLVEPSGTLDTTNSVYEPLDERRVKVSGSRFLPADTYTLKLEGAELAGYESFTLGAVRDPVILRQIDPWVAGMRQRMVSRIEDDLGLRDGVDYQLIVRIYGRDGVLGRIEPVPRFEGHEALLFIDVVAQSDELARTLIRAANHVGMHFPVPEWTGSITGYAHPLVPGCVDRGPVFRFNMNHVVEVDDPCELYRFAYEDVG
jgi:hypothetical protein